MVRTLPRARLHVSALIAVLGSSVLAQSAAAAAAAAELQSRTVQAFDRYVRLTEARLSRGAPFVWIDGLAEAQRREAIEIVRKGELSIERLETRDGGREIEVPGGMIHHWVGTAFVPGASVDQALAILQDYNAHQRIYAPTVATSRLLSRDGDRFRFFLRFVMKKGITVVVNSEHDAQFRRPAADRAEGWIHSTRIAEVENAGQPNEREKPIGDDGGYLWRLNTYWRLLARDGGLYIHCESVSLSRGIPLGLGWIVGPFVTSIPRESLTFTLDTTRKQLERSRKVARR
jgi:hypothetical protein